MKITFEEIINQKSWLTECVLSALSTSDEALISGQAERSYDVKLLINGIELEPVLLQTIFENATKYIDQEAEKIFKEKYQEQSEELRHKMDEMTNMIDAFKTKVKEKFNIQDDEY